ncbi:Putative transposase (identified by ISEscan HMM) [Klebsiella pneumoniae]|nr:Putative transposase (identified by ISEscan HMM) [Klebsiella pneumoniae]
MLRGNGHAVDDSLLQYLSPLAGSTSTLTGDYLWRSSQDRRGSSGRYGLCNRLSVLYFPFSETTPIMAKVSFRKR